MKVEDISASWYSPWRVIVSEQDGLGGGDNVEYWFKTYELAHEFYEYIKSQKGKPFHPSIALPPHLCEFPAKYTIHDKPFWGAK